MDDRTIQLHLLTEQQEVQLPSCPPAANFANIAKTPRTRLTTWTWETCGIIVSAALIVALVIVLRYYEGNLKPAWDHMSLNTLVAWISTVAKACILFSVSQALGQLKWVWSATERRPLEDMCSFDSASRGVLGSLALIYRVRARHFAVVGSLAIVLAVGFDPFLQNLVHYASRDEVDAFQSCLLGNTTMYNTVGPLMGGNTHYVDPLLKANVYSALFDQGTNQPWATPQYTCTTGNCTWDPTANLAMRALCSNVTSHLTRSCSYGSHQRCNVTLGDTLGIFYLASGGQSHLMGVTTVHPEAALVYQNSSFPVVQYILANGSNSDSPVGGGLATEISNSTQFISTECSLEPLVRSVKPFVSLSVYQETVLAEWAVLNNTESGFGDFKLVFSPNWNNGSSLGLTSPGSYATTDTLQALFYGNFSSSCDIDDQLTCALDNVAVAISKTIRDTAFSGGAKHDLHNTVNTNITPGHTITSASFVVVRWEWLLLPLLVWLLATVSWIGAAWRSGRNVPRWKNDILPLLFLYRPARIDQSIGSDLNLMHQQQSRVKLDQGQLVDA